MALCPALGRCMIDHYHRFLGMSAAPASIGIPAGGSALPLPPPRQKAQPSVALSLNNPRISGTARSRRACPEAFRRTTKQSSSALHPRMPVRIIHKSATATLRTHSVERAMSVEAFLKRLREAPDEIEFADTIAVIDRSEEHTSELQSLMRISYAVFC